MADIPNMIFFGLGMADILDFFFFFFFFFFFERGGGGGGEGVLNTRCWGPAYVDLCVQRTAPPPPTPG